MMTNDDDDDDDENEDDEDPWDQVCLSQGAQRPGSDPVGACGDHHLRRFCRPIMELVVSVE